MSCTGIVARYDLQIINTRKASAREHCEIVFCVHMTLKSRKLLELFSYQLSNVSEHKQLNNMDYPTQIIIDIIITMQQ